MESVKLVVPKEVRDVSDALQAAGFEAYLVGGCVRDLILGREPKDWDITTGATPEKIQSLFEDTFYENEYGTVGVVTTSEDPRLKVIEVTPYRTEGKYADARHPDERFEEDALRMLRAVRIAAELDFVIDAQTAEGIAAQSPQLAKISRERVRDELIRILLCPRPMQALYVAQKLGILKYVIPELEEGIGCAQNQAHSFDVFEHLMRSLQHAAYKDWPLDVRLAALLHDVGKPRARVWSEEKKDWTFHGHDVVSARMAEKILNELKFPKETTHNVATLVRTHMFFSEIGRAH